MSKKRKAPTKKNTIIKTSPATLNESTLEANIATEIATLFNSPFNFGYPFRLRWLFEFNRVNLAAFRKRKSKLYRLTPIEENSGGGWDTKISIPKGQNDERAIFIQFKRGYHSEGNNVTGSMFNLDIQSPNPHAEFSFNDNTSKTPGKSNNQHNTFKNLAVHLAKNGISSKSVMYAFPRITKLDDFAKLEEDLILHTTFLTIDEMDSEARRAKVDLYDRKKHHFRTCYISENRREIASETFPLTNVNEQPNVLYEIFLVKLARFRNLYSQAVPVRYLNNQISIMLADYLKINPGDSELFRNQYTLQTGEDLVEYFSYIESENKKSFTEIFGESGYNDMAFAWRQDLYKRIVDFFANNEDIIDISSIPAEYTFNLDNEKAIEINFPAGDKIYSDLNLITF